MSTCCPDQITYFNNRTTTNVPYGGQFGDTPTVVVMYLINGEWRTPQGATTQIKLEYGQATNNFNAKGLPINAPVNNPVINNIHVDHGGAATGLVKIS